MHLLMLCLLCYKIRLTKKTKLDLHSEVERKGVTQIIDHGRIALP